MDMEQGRGGGEPCFEAILGGASSKRYNDGWENYSVEDLCCRTEQRYWAVGAAFLTWLHALRIGKKMEFFQIARM